MTTPSAPSTYEKIKIALLISGLVLGTTTLLYHYSASKSCHSEAGAALGLESGERFIATPDNAISYSTYYEACSHKKGL